MNQLLEYIVQNYAWFLVGIILVLLAIVGYYADKTNFGQGKPEEPNNDALSDLDNSTEGNLDGIYTQLEDNSQLKELNEQVVQSANIGKTDMVTTGIENTDVGEEATSNIFSKEEVEKFNNEFNAILPEKEIISTDLLSDIEDLEFDKTQKIDLSYITDLNNIELPKIKKFVPEEEDIWKF